MSALSGGKGPLSDVRGDRLPSLVSCRLKDDGLALADMNGQHRLARVEAGRSSSSRHIPRVSEVLRPPTFGSSISPMNIARLSGYEAQRRDYETDDHAVGDYGRPSPIICPVCLQPTTTSERYADCMHYPRRVGDQP